MRFTMKLLGLIFLFLFAAHTASYGADQPVPVTPFMRTVTPDNGLPGDILTVAGQALDKARVKELYLTDGKKDIKAEILEQSEEAIKFRLPAKAAPGRYSLMVLTAGEPKYIEQPVYVVVKKESKPPETGI